MWLNQSKTCRFFHAWCLYLDLASRPLWLGQINWKFDHQQSDSRRHWQLQPWDWQQDVWSDRALGYQWVQQVGLSFVGFNLSPVDANLLVFLSVPVPKPTVSIECNRELSSCDLTCKANITSHFGPVTYRWESGDKLLSSKIKLSLTAVGFKMQPSLWVETILRTRDEPMMLHLLLRITWSPPMSACC